MQASSSFYIPPRPHPTPLQRRRAVRSSGLDSGTEDESSTAHLGLSTVGTTGPSYSTNLTASPLESFSSGFPAQSGVRLERAKTTVTDHSPEISRSAATLSGLKIRTVAAPSRPVTTSPTLQKKVRRHRDDETTTRANDFLDPQQVSRSRSIVQAFDPEPRDGPIEPRQVSRSKSIVQMFDPEPRVPEEPSAPSGTRSRSRRVKQDLEESNPVQRSKVSRSKSYAPPGASEKRRSEARQVSRSNSRSNRTNSRLSRSSSHARSIHRAETSELRRLSRSKTDVPSRKPSVRRSKTAPVPHVSDMPILHPLSSAVLPSHPQLPSASQSHQPLQHRVSRSNSRVRRETQSRPVNQSYLRYLASPSGETADEELENSDVDLYDSPKALSSCQTHDHQDEPRGPRQPAHPMLSREKPEQITILKGSQSAYPLLRKSTQGDIGEILLPPPVPREFSGRSRSGTPEPRRPRLRTSASQTLPNGYTFPTAISQMIPRGPMRPLCAVPTRGYTAEAISPLLRFEAEQDEPVDRRVIASPVSGISMNTSSADHGVVMINGRPFSPDHRPFSPDMITSESSLPATPEASDMGHHLLQVYGDDVQPTLEQLINEQLPITLRPVELDDAGSAYVVDLSKAARKAARRAERIAEKEAKKEAKAVRRATKKDKSRGASVIVKLAPEEPHLGENEIRRAAALAAKLEAEVIAQEAEAAEASEQQTLQESKDVRRIAREAEKAEARRLAEVQEAEQMAEANAAEQRLEEEKEIRRTAFRAEKREEERAERAAFEKKRAEERAAREAKEAASEEAERVAIAEEEDAKARARIARRQTARATVLNTAGPTSPTSPTSHTEPALLARKSTRRQPTEEPPKTPAQLEKEAYQASRARAEIESLQKEIDDKLRVTSNLELMANTLARARRARRDSKVLDYGYPSAEFDPPHRTEGMGLKLVTSGGGTHLRPKKSKANLVAMVASVVPGLPKTDGLPKGFRSISYADLQEAAADRQAEIEERGWEAEAQIKTLQKEQSRSKDFKEWSRRKKSTEVARRLSVGNDEVETGCSARRGSEDPRLAALAQGRMYGEEEEEWETDEGGSDHSNRQYQSHHSHHSVRQVEASSTPLSEAEISDQWEDLSAGSRSISDQEVYFRTSDLDEPHRRKSKSIKSPMTPDMARPQPLRRASTVRLLKLEKLAVEEHPLPEPQGIHAGGVRSGVSSRATSVGSAPWFW